MDTWTSWFQNTPINRILYHLLYLLIQSYIYNSSSNLFTSTLLPSNDFNNDSGTAIGRAFQQLWSCVLPAEGTNKYTKRLGILLWFHQPRKEFYMKTTWKRVFQPQKLDLTWLNKTASKDIKSKGFHQFNHHKIRIQPTWIGFSLRNIYKHCMDLQAVETHLNFVCSPAASLSSFGPHLLT